MGVILYQNSLLVNACIMMHYKSMEMNRKKSTVVLSSQYPMTQGSGQGNDNHTASSVNLILVVCMYNVCMYVCMINYRDDDFRARYKLFDIIVYS